MNSWEECACRIAADPTIFLLGRRLGCGLGCGLWGLGLLRRLLGRLALLGLGPRPRAGLLGLLRLGPRPGLGPRHGALRGPWLRRLGPRPRLLQPLERQLLVVVKL